MQIIKKIERADFRKLSARPKIDKSLLDKLIKEIFEEVNLNGDAAILHYSEKFDGNKTTDLQVDPLKIEGAFNVLDKRLLDSLQVAKRNIEKFHKSQIKKDIEISTMQGVKCMQISKPISKVGIYIPGGSAPLFSTILMLAIPAKIAGCKEIIMCTPAGKDGEINPVVLATAHLCGISAVYQVGGAQAIAAMSVGTESIPKVHKIYGPGNQYVTAAKEYASNFGIAIDMPAGPSEVLVYADETSKPQFVASDLLSQAEHGSDSQVVCVATSIDLANKIIEEVNLQLQYLSRTTIAYEALKNSFIIVEKDIQFAFDYINEYAPEHLIIASENFNDYVPLIENAGSVFLGNYCPESAGDYASGTNHTLPTSGWAKSYSGVNLDAFMKKISLQTIDKNGLRGLGPVIMNMAYAENLDAHANAVKIRLDYLKSIEDE